METKYSEALDELNSNLMKIKEKGLCKLRLLGHEMNKQRQGLTANFEKLKITMDERASKIKSDIDVVHEEMKNQLDRIRSDTLRKTKKLMEEYKREIKDINGLVQKGLDVLVQQRKDMTLLNHVNLNLSEKLNHVKQLQIESEFSRPFFTPNFYSKDDINFIFGYLNVKSKYTKHEKGQKVIKDVEIGRIKTTSVETDIKTGT